MSSTCKRSESTNLIRPGGRTVSSSALAPRFRLALPEPAASAPAPAAAGFPAIFPPAGVPAAGGGAAVFAGPTGGPPRRGGGRAGNPGKVGRVDGAFGLGSGKEVLTAPTG